MPIIKPSKYSAPIHYPNNNYKVVKYLDLTKYISLLSNKALFFCRLDKLEDHFEGTTSDLGYKKIKASLERIIDSPNDDIEKQVVLWRQREKKDKSLKCVSCWSKSEIESVALWKIYSSLDSGIMITSSIDNLNKSFINTNETVELSEIQYLDFKKDDFPIGNSNFPIIHKHKSYSFEEEVRLIYSVDYLLRDFDWSKEKIEFGKNLSVNVNDLIDSVTLSPYSPSWFIKLVKDVTKKLGYSFKINRSELTPAE